MLVQSSGGSRFFSKIHILTSSEQLVRSPATVKISLLLNGPLSIQIDVGYYHSIKSIIVHIGIYDHASYCCDSYVSQCHMQDYWFLSSLGNLYSNFWYYEKQFSETRFSGQIQLKCTIFVCTNGFILSISLYEIMPNINQNSFNIQVVIFAIQLHI